MSKTPTLDELLSLPVGRRELAARNLRAYHESDTFEAVLRLIREAVLDDLARAEDLARVGREIGRALGGDAAAVGEAQLGNVLRVRNRFGAARSHLEAALQLGKGSKTVRQIWSYVASLEESVRRFDAARRALDQAEALAPSTEERLGLLVQRGNLLGYERRPRAAVRSYASALKLISKATPQYRALTVFHGLAWNLADCALPDEATVIYQLAGNLRIGAASRVWRKLRWLEGHIAAAARHYTSARVALLETVDGYISDGMPYEAALCALELLGVMIESGDADRLEDLRHDAKEALSLLGLGDSRWADANSKNEVDSALQALRLWHPADAEVAAA